MYWLPARLYQARTFTKRDSMHLTGARQLFFPTAVDRDENPFMSEDQKECGSPPQRELDFAGMYDPILPSIQSILAYARSDVQNRNSQANGSLRLKSVEVCQSVRAKKMTTRVKRSLPVDKRLHRKRRSPNNHRKKTHIPVVKKIDMGP